MIVEVMTEERTNEPRYEFTRDGHLVHCSQGWTRGELKARAGDAIFEAMEEASQLRGKVKQLREDVSNWLANPKDLTTEELQPYASEYAARAALAATEPKP